MSDPNPKEIEMMTTKTTTVEIWDCGCGVILSVDDEGFYDVLNSGGCDVTGVLGAAILWDATEPPQELANRILADWVEEYDGDPAQNGLRVIVKRGGFPLAESAA